MSATNRGSKRIEADFYKTPESAFKPLIPFLPRDGQIFDPAWGDARLVKWMLEAGLDADGTDLHDKDHPVDYLTDTTKRFCVATNPPFSLAWKFCKHAVRHAQHVYLLYRLGFLASQKRMVWFREHEPSALFVLSQRPSFAVAVACVKAKARPPACHFKTMIDVDSPRPKVCPACGAPVTITTSDSADYAWFYWGSLYKGIYHLL